MTQAARITLYLYIAAALFITLFTVYLCYSIEWRGPMRDLWEFIAIIEDQRQGHWDWLRLVEPYGGIHRILIPKLLFYLDYQYFSGSNLLSLSTTLLLHAGSAALLVYTISRASDISFENKLLLSALVLLFFFSTTQIYNLIYNSDNQVVISNSLAVLAAWFFSRKRIVAANIVVLMACLSHSSSLMLLPAMVVVLFCLGYHWRQYGWWLIFSAVILLLYVSGHDPLNPSAQSIPLWKKIISTLYASVMQLPGIAKYIGLHLSSPTSRLWPNSGILLSYISIGYLAFVLYRIRWRQQPLTTLGVFCLTLSLYGVFIALVTAYGRQIYPGSALTDRYQTLVMTYWAALLILLFYDLNSGIKNKTGQVTPFVLSLLLLLPHQITAATDMAWLSSRVTRAHTAAITGITDIKTIAATLSHPLLMDNKNLVAAHNNFLRENKLAYFSYDYAAYFHDANKHQQLDAPVTQSEACRGKLISTEVISHNTSSNKQFRLKGQSGQSGKPADHVLIIDRSNQVIGLGRDVRPKGEFKPTDWRKMENSQWAGFINSADAIQTPLRVVGKSGNGYCEFFSIKKI